MNRSDLLVVVIKMFAKVMMRLIDLRNFWTSGYGSHHIRRLFTGFSARGLQSGPKAPRRYSVRVKNKPAYQSILVSFVVELFWKNPAYSNTDISPCHCIPTSYILDSMEPKPVACDANMANIYNPSRGSIMCLKR